MCVCKDLFPLFRLPFCSNDSVLCLTENLAIVQTEPELALCCDKVGFPVEGLWHCLSHTTINLQSVLTIGSIRDWCLPQLSSEILHPVTDGNRCDNKHPSIGWHSGKPPDLLKRGRKECMIQDGKDITQRQLTWAPGGSQILTNAQGALMGPT